MEPRAHIPPPQIQTMRDSPTEPACSSTPLGEINIPEPMMLPVEKRKSFTLLLLYQELKHEYISGLSLEASQSFPSHRLECVIWGKHSDYTDHSIYKKKNLFAIFGPAMINPQLQQVFV